VNRVRGDYDGITHIRAALRQFLRSRRTVIRSEIPVPEKMILDSIPVVIRSDIVKQLRELGGTLGQHVERAVKRYHRIGKRKPAGSEGSHGEYTLGTLVYTELTWDAPEESRKLLPSDPRDQPAYTRAAIYRHLKNEKERK
jgi:hypothetical protein